MSKVKISIYIEKRADEDWNAFIPDLSKLKEIEIEAENIIRIREGNISIIYFKDGTCIASPLKKEEIEKRLALKGK